MGRGKAWALVCLGVLTACDGGEPAREEERVSDAVCAAGDLAKAPWPRDVDGLHAVPIDIERIEARVVLDAAAKSASAEVTVRFTMGIEDGHPLFDLRQHIGEASLNGVALQPAALAHHDLGGGADAALRVVGTSLPACSQNTLVLRYPLALPEAPGARALAWGLSDARAYWDFWLSDLSAGRYLEMWLPANLIYDRFALALDLTLAGADVEHTLLTNGKVEVLGAHHWRVDYPAHFTALSPLLVLRPAADLESRTATLPLSPTRQLTLSLHRLRLLDADLAAVERDIAAHLEEFTRSTGEYAHGDALTVYLWNEASRSMEYDGATTTTLGALKHELFHSWYGRGVKPASQRDGWLDEAWTMYNTEPGLAFQVRAFRDSDPPVDLSPQNPWTRVTPTASYARGQQFFAGLAARMGVSALVGHMRSFYVAHAGDVVTTAQLERHLVCATRDAQVSEAFGRYVYGGRGPTVRPGDCP